MPTGSGRALLGLVALLLAASASASAETPSPVPSAAAPDPGAPAAGADAAGADAAGADADQAAETRAPVRWLRPEEVPLRAESLQRALASAQADAATRDVVARIERELALRVPELETMLLHARAAVARATSFVELEDLRRELADADAALAGWETVLMAEAKRLAEALDEIAAARATWRETRARPETVAAGEAVERRVTASLAAVDEAEQGLRPWRIRVLALSDRVVDRRTAVETARKRVEAATAKEWSRLFVPDRPPLWQAGFLARLGDELPRVPAALRAYAGATVAYVARDPRPFVVQLVLAALLVVGFRRVAPRARGGDDASSAGLAHPTALAILVAILATPWVHPGSPQRFRQLAAIIALAPAARLMLPVTGRAGLVGFLGLFLLLLADRLSLAVAPLPATARVAVLVALVIALGLAVWLARVVRRTGGPRWLRQAAGVAVAALAVAVPAEIGGWQDLAAVLGRGTVASVVIGVFLYAAIVGIEPFVVWVLDTPWLRRSHLFERNRIVLRQRVGWALRALGALVWVAAVLRSVGLQGTAVEGLRGLLRAGVSVGALSISVATVLAFILTLLAALVIARTVTGVLEEDVYPRTSLPRGMPFVVTTLVRYAVYSLGFLIALAAAGIALDQLTILLGGLGVGIGLGLQDLVKNFAAGLTLLVERRVHPGDVVQIPGQEIFGRVLSIGMRATLVRSWNGSEVVVPNADLIATAITNWTLSDRLCRLEVPVGVAYGTDPDRVVALLVEAARRQPRLLAEPPPQAIFKGFGESSLDFELRAWTDEGIDQRIVMTSDLALAVHRALAEAGITIPFPQRDLHLASVSPEAGAALAGLERKR